MEENGDDSESSSVAKNHGFQSDDVEEVVVYLTEGRALVIGPHTVERSRWGRWLRTRPSAVEFRTLLARLDHATRAYVESQAWIGRYVELDPQSRAMWGDGFKAFTDEHGWSHANLRNEETSKYARLMRVRRLDGVGEVANVTAFLGAMATQAESAEIAQTLTQMSNKLSEISKHQTTDQIGAVENTIEQVDGLVLRLREHGLDAVHESDFATVRNSLGDARRKVLGHLRDEIGSVEKASAGTALAIENALGEGRVARASVYFDLLGQVRLATLQLELGQVAFYLLQDKPDVAGTWTTRVAKQIENFDMELEGESKRVELLHSDVCGQFQPAWKHALTPGDNAKEATLATGTVFAAGAKKLVGDKTIKVGGITVPGSAAIAVAGIVGAGVGNGCTRARNAVIQPRAQKRVKASLQELADNKELSLSTLSQAQPSLDLLRSVAGDISGASDVLDLPG